MNSAIPPRKRGCLFYGCLITSVVAVIGIVVAVLAIRFTVKKLDQAVAVYTETQPATVQEVEIAATDLTNLQGRVDTFEAALKSGTEAQELVLTADEINALIGHDPDFKELDGKLFVTIEGDQVKGHVSLPLRDFGPLKLQGRYLNGVGTFGIGLENGKLQIKLREMKVNDKPLPPQLMSLLQEKLAKDIRPRDPDTAKVIQKFDTIKVEDSKLILRSKAR